MLVGERRDLIERIVLAAGSASVSQLSQELAVSEETIRRDLIYLEKRGVLKRTYGGAFGLNGMHRDIPFSIRSVAYVEEKKRIASACAAMVEEGDTIFLDCSTTALHIAEAIKQKNHLVVITNSLPIGWRLAESRTIKVVVLGGKLRKSALSTVGEIARRELSAFNSDTAFVSCEGFDMKWGLTDADEEEAEIRRMMLEHAESRVLIADHTKLGRTAFCAITPLETVGTLVTDKQPSPDWVQFLAKKNVRLIVQPGPDDEPSVSDQ